MLRIPMESPYARVSFKEFTSKFDISEDLHPELPGPEERIVDFPEGKVGTRPHAAHEVPLLTATANRVIAMEDATLTSGSSGTPSTEAQDELSQETPPEEVATTTEVVPELRLEKEMAAMGPPVNKRRYNRDKAEAEANAPPKILRKDHAPVCPE
ncbi:hypothetical protein Tco_0422672 [Tanacetum coccineum]